MYKRHEASAIKRKFWTSFGQYMKPVSSAWNDEVNWINYHTGIKDVFFRMDAERHFATCSIELMAKDDDLRHRFFDQFVLQRTYFQSIMGDDWVWEKDVADQNGRSISRISKRLDGVNVLNENDWPPIISFFKPSIMAFDSFWADAKDGFEMLLYL